MTKKEEKICKNGSIGKKDIETTLKISNLILCLIVKIEIILVRLHNFTSK